MKRFLFLVCALALLCTVLGGCGIRGDKTPMETPAATMDLLPDLSPVPTPDVDNGVVTDHDGVIESREPVITAAPTASPSASPAASARP